MWYFRPSTLLIIVTIFYSVRAKRKLKEQEIIQRILKDYDWRKEKGREAPQTSFAVIMDKATRKEMKDEEKEER
uniref:Uncharacterized protein n=1 Tax=Caenorhabditis japonica TaxID=281687 RepID=A0A8R1DPK4_CAEJA